MRAPFPKSSPKSVCPLVRVPVRGAAPLLVSLVSLGSLALACASGVPQTLGGTANERPPIDARTRALYARTNLEKARALREQGRLDVAESVTRRGLSYEPDEPALLRLRADLLERLGRKDEARALREHADRVDPPPPPLDDAPDPRSSPDTRVLVALLPPSPALLDSLDTRDRLPRHWPADEAAKTLRTRFGVRLPDARIEVLGSGKRPSARTVPATRAWLAGLHADALVSVRVDRSFCGRSVKDGDFAVAWLRVAVALPNAATADTHLVRTVLDRPDGPGCKTEALARAVERVLELRSLKDALRAGAAPAGEAFTNASIRAAFPELGARLDAEVAQGRRYLSLGELDLALERFRAATGIDPEDRVALSFRDDVQRTIELAGMLEPAPGKPADGGGHAPSTPPAHPRAAVHLDPQLSPSQRRGLEAQLAHEKRRREEMLSTLAVMDGVRRAPTGAALAALHPGAIDDPQATGPTLARARSPEGRAVEMRTLYGPEGNVVARYYFARGGDSPILREDDTDGDGHPDRWIAYEQGLVSEVWEAQTPGAAPTLHIVYAPGGAPIERVEIDQNGDGRVDRLFVYSDGRLREESSDTNGDGAFDRFQHFDESGSLTLREEDVDGDEQIDVRTAYNNGRIVRREILNQSVLDHQLGTRVQ